MLSAPLGSPPPEFDSSSGDFLRLVHEGWRMLGAATVGGCVIGLVYAALVTPIYRATATLEVQDLNENFLDLKQVASSSMAPPVVNDMQTQVRILQSHSLIARVIRRVGPPPGLGAVAGASAPAPREAKPNASAKGTKEKDPTPGDPSSDFSTEVQKGAELEAAGRALQVRESRMSRIVDLAFESPDPAYAAAFLNQLGQQFIDRSIDSRLDISSNTSAFLDHQIEELRTKLTASERKLQAYANKSGLLVTSQEGRPDEERLRQVQAELSKAQENRMSKQARWEMVASASPESLESPLGHTLRDHQTKVADLRRQRADLLAVYTPDFAPVKRLDAQIADLETTVRKNQTAIVDGVKNDYNDSRRREELLQGSYEAQIRQVAGKASSAIQYGILKNEVDSNREIYNKMLQRAAEARFASALRASSARFVDRAHPPRSPVRPSRLLSLICGGTAGFLCGLVLISVRSRGRGAGVPRPYAVQPSTVPQLGAVPAAPAALEEGYRAILTSILLTPLAGSSPRVVAVTSASSGEGKSELIHQLAATLSQMKRRVLLMDVTLNGGLRRLLAATGVSTSGDLLAPDSAGSGTLSHVTDQTELEGVELMSFGSRSGALDVAAITRLLAEMREVYDIVLVDTPALLEQPDGRMLAKISDGVVLVVRSGITSPEAVNTVVRRLQWDGSVVLGTVVNRGDETAMGD